MRANPCSLPSQKPEGRHSSPQGAVSCLVQHRQPCSLRKQHSLSIHMQTCLLFSQALVRVSSIAKANIQKQHQNTFTQNTAEAFMLDVKNTELNNCVFRNAYLLLVQGYSSRILSWRVLG